MELLMIGNSYTVDCSRYLHRIARAGGEKINTICLYIGGCPLERHFRNMHSGEEAYEFYVNGEPSGFKVSLAEALTNRSWDVITFQQASFQSYDYETYQPYLDELADYCDEFLVHGVDVEGKSSGIDEELAAILAEYNGNKITYAGGIGSMEDLERFRELTGGKVDFTIGSALDLFGGKLPYNKIKYYKDKVNTL